MNNKKAVESRYFLKMWKKWECIIIPIDENHFCQLIKQYAKNKKELVYREYIIPMSKYVYRENEFEIYYYNACSNKHILSLSKRVVTRGKR